MAGLQVHVSSSSGREGGQVGYFWLFETEVDRTAPGTLIKRCLRAHLILETCPIHFHGYGTQDI